MTAIEQLLRCYEDAALQRHLMHPRADDLALIDDGWRIFHAVDTNVISCYLEPAESAERNDFRIIGDGEIFRADTRESKENIARLISDFILFGLDPAAQLIALRPINIEIRNMYLRLAGQFLARVPPDVEIDDHLMARLQAVADLRHPQKIRADLTAALRLDLSGDEAVRRIRKITRARRILGSDMITAESHGAALAAAMPSDRRTSDQLELVPRANQWLKRLDQVGRPIGRAPAKRDAEALAKLQLCNERLERAGTPMKIVYVTSDSSLLNAGEDFPWSKETGVSNFSREFIRHPRAYLDEPDVLRPSRATNLLDADTLYGWLTLLLGRLEGAASEIRPHRGQVAFVPDVISTLMEIAEDDAEAASKIIKKWKVYAREAFGDAPEGFVARLIESLNSKPGAALVKQLWTEVRGARADAWDTVLEVTAGARFALEVWYHDSPSGIPARETPRLVFEGRTALHEFLKHAEMWLDDADSFKHENYDRLRRAVQNEYDGTYGDYMAHAYLLAQQMEWESAEILASLATSKADKFTGLATGSNGRESSYLEAYCGRLKSSSKGDLKKPISGILRALRVAKRERMVTEAAGRWHDCAEERFVVELLVLKMTRHLYDWYDDVESDPSRDPKTCRVAELDAMRGYFGALADRTRVRIAALPEQRVEEPYDEARISAGLRSALGRCYRSGLGLALQFGRIDAETEGMWSQLKKMVAEDTLPPHHSRSFSCQFAQFIVSLGDLLFSDQLSIKRRRKELNSLRWTKPAAILPYDVRRYEMMIETVDSLLKQRQ